MAIVKKPEATFKVNIIESEAGWGSKIDDTIYFDNEAEARQYAIDYNKKWNTATTTPSWYMVAEYAGAVR